MSKKVPLFPKFLDWLENQGISSYPKGEQLTTLKKQHRKEYLRHYHRSYYKRRTKQVKLEISPEEREQFLRYALEYPQFTKSNGQANLSRFILEAARAYCAEERLPENPELLREVQVQLRKIGGTINGLVHRFHRKGYASVNEIELLRVKIETIETLFMEHQTSKK